jgi:hypothetical protein
VREKIRFRQTNFWKGLTLAANGWTKDRKRRQAELIRKWRPWESSTGPKTARGKAAVSRNAWKHGYRSAKAIAEFREMRWLLKAMDEATEAAFS